MSLAACIWIVLVVRCFREVVFSINQPDKTLTARILEDISLANESQNI